MNGYLVLIDHWSGGQLIYAVMASDIETARTQAAKHHGERSEIVGIQKMNDQGQSIFAGNHADLRIEHVSRK